jgi:hypothetical protein
MSGLTPTERSRLREQLRAELAPIPGVDPVDLAPRERHADRLRRRGLRPKATTTTYTLADVNGVLVWEEGFGLRSTSRLRRGGAGMRAAEGEVIERVQVQPLELGNEISQYLASLDDRWTPASVRGLREWDGTTLSAQALPPGKPVESDGPVLVLVHGTFSRPDVLLNELNLAPNHRTFAQTLRKRYKKIYAFGHPTVSVSPVLNAVELSRHFRGCKQPVDIIAHSRGGLVVRWWLEVMDYSPAARRRAVFIGAPLNGTGLATPKRIRDALSWLSNVNQALATTADLSSALIPFLSVVGGLLRFTSTVTGVIAKTPLVDAGFSMIPGLSAMTRVNLELARLNVHHANRPEYFAVDSDFEPAEIGLAVWKFLTEAKVRVANAAADRVFDGPNDLVVDTDSMTFLCAATDETAGACIGKVHSFGKQGRVHHTNYFRQPETLDFMSTALELNA